MKNSMSYSQNVRQERIRVNNHGSFTNNPQRRQINNIKTRASINGFYQQTDNNKKSQEQQKTSPKPQQGQIQPTSTYYQNLPISHPLSPNGKRIQQQLQLFRFDQKIQEIQSQQILQLIEQHIKAQNQKKSDMVKEVIGRSFMDRQSFSRSNAFRLYKNASFSRAKAKGNEERNERYVEVRNVRTNESFKQEKEEGQAQGKQQEQTHPEHKNVVTYLKQKSQSRQPLTQPHRPSKPSLPLWQRNLFHQKLLLKQQSKSLQTTKPNQFFPSSKLIDTSPFSSSPQNIKHYLSQLYSKSFSLTKNYQFYLNAKGHKLNPETKKELMEQLKISKQDEKLLLDNRNKSFAGYSKVKSLMYSTKAQMLYNTSAVWNHDSGHNHSQHNSHNHNHTNVQTDSSLTSHKLTYLRPIRLSKQSKNHLLLFQSPPNPRAHRIRNLNEPSSSNQQQYQAQIQDQYIKFRETYKEKLIDDKQLQKLISQRNKKSRQAVSPYHHELSAWN